MSYPIPKDALDDRLAFVGTAGSGKTYNACTGVEMLLHRASRVVVADPLGVWWGLRLRADGKTPSAFNVVIFGGPHGDIAINEHAGALIGETVAGMAESCIVDLSQIGTKAGERRFMLAFLTALYRKTAGEPLHLVVDEADMFAPQRLMDRDGDAARLLGMMETIVRRGRVKGFIPWLITQRPAVLSKDVLSQADGMVAFKLTASQDRAAIGAWIEGQADQQQGKQILASLPSMRRGQGVVWVPGRSILETAAFPEKSTFDSSRTPKRGETKRTATLKPLDLGALKDRLSTIEAETKENDPKALKAEVARLTQALVAKAPAPTVMIADPKVMESVRIEGYERGLAEGLNRGENRAKAALAAVQERLKDAAAITGNAIDSLDSPASPTAARPQVIAPPARSALSMPVPSDASVSPTVRKILDVIHRAAPVALTFDAASLRAGVSRRSSAYRSYRAQVDEHHEVIRRGDGRYTSAPGIAAPIGAGGDPIEEFAAKLPPSYARMLRSIAGVVGAVSKDEIAALAEISPTSSGLGAGLSELIALSLIERNGTLYQLHQDLRS